MTGGPAEPSSSRDRACPCPGCDAASPRNRIRQQSPLWSPVVEKSEKEMMYSSPGNPMLSIEDESAIPSSIPPTETEHPYILAVDDEQSILSLLVSLLGSVGHNCVAFVESQWVLPLLQK